jgi:tetratricopeptide (TPR) repeat protein
MKQQMKQIRRMALLILATAFTATMSFAQTPQQQPSQPGQQPGQPQPGQPSQSGQPNSNSQPLTMDSNPPVNAEEEAAIKQFRDEQDPAKKDELAEKFLQKYPQSRYLAEVYNWQVKSYYRQGNIDKMEVAADKQLELFPNDPQTLALVGTTLPRAWNASMSDDVKKKRLEKSEKYCQKALELLPTVPKPENMTQERYQDLKAETYSMAYSGLGLVEFRRGKFDDAIPDLEKAVKADPQEPDPVTFYVLGKADEQTSHYDDAVTAFTKCAAIAGGMKNTCTQSIDEAKKLGATQPSSPK